MRNYSYLVRYVLFQNTSQQRDLFPPQGDSTLMGRANNTGSRFPCARQTSRVGRGDLWRHSAGHPARL